MSLCGSCHKQYDGIPEVIAESNRNRKGEKRSGYVIKMDPKEFSAQQAAKGLGHTVTEEHRQKLITSNKDRKGEKRSQEAKDKMSKSHKGKPWSAARRAAHERRYGGDVR
jgi:hypothetical protein